MEDVFKTCMEIINEAKRYLERKDYNGLKLYLDEKEKYVENCKIMSKDKASEYIDSLINDIKNN